MALAGRLSSLAKGVNMNKPLRTDRRAWFVAGLIASAAVSVSAADFLPDFLDSENPVKRGYAIVPAGVVLNLAGKDRQLVGLGSYVVNTSGCVDCRSHPTYSPGEIRSGASRNGSMPKSACPADVSSALKLRRPI
jgi:hypothetical protein